VTKRRLGDAFIRRASPASHMGPADTKATAKATGSGECVTWPMPITLSKEDTGPCRACGRKRERNQIACFLLT
jgi:hypothetical protein